MANFSPIVNTRGMIYTYEDGIVLRSTYHVFDAYVNDMEANYLDTAFADSSLSDDNDIDYVVTVDDNGKNYAVSIINRNPDSDKLITISLDGILSAEHVTVNGPDKDSYNDVNKNDVCICKKAVIAGDNSVTVDIEPHSVNVLKISTK